MATTADVKISQLPAGAAANLTDLMEASQLQAPGSYLSYSLTLSQVMALASTNLGIAGLAPIASPAFTGTPTAPTQAPTDNDTSIATTAFVQTAITGLAKVSGTLVAGNVLIAGAGGTVADSGVQLIPSLPAQSVWGNNSATTSPPAALTRLTLGNGTAAAPAYSFGSSLGTGVYSASANILQLASNSNLGVQIRSTEATNFIEFLLNNASTSTIRAQGGTNTSLLVAANGTGEVDLETNGTGANPYMLRVLPTGTAGSANNYTTLKTGATGANPVFAPAAQGTGDTNIGFDFNPVGAAGIRCQNNFFHARYNGSIIAGSTTQCFIKASSATDFGIYYGTGAPAFTAGKGSLYIQTDATTTTSRFWVNTTGSTTWANFTSSA